MLPYPTETYRNHVKISWVTRGRLPMMGQKIIPSSSDQPLFEVPRGCHALLLWSTSTWNRIAIELLEPDIWITFIAIVLCHSMLVGPYCNHWNHQPVYPSNKIVSKWPKTMPHQPHGSRWSKDNLWQIDVQFGGSNPMKTTRHSSLRPKIA